jgi:hypothetical protein
MMNAEVNAEFSILAFPIYFIIQNSAFSIQNSAFSIQNYLAPRIK